MKSGASLDSFYNIVKSKTILTWNIDLFIPHTYQNSLLYYKNWINFS